LNFIQAFSCKHGPDPSENPGEWISSLSERVVFIENHSGG